MEREKPCSTCGEMKPATDQYFGKNKSTSDGLEYLCKPCKAKKQAEYRAKKMGKVVPKRSVRQKPPVVSRGPANTGQKDLESNLREIKKLVILDFLKNELPTILEERFG